MHVVHRPGITLTTTYSIGLLMALSRYLYKILYALFGYFQWYYSDVMMDAMAPQITSLTIVYSTVYSGADQRKHKSSASLVFVWGIHWWPVKSPHKWPVMRKMYPFDDVIMGKTYELKGMAIHRVTRVAGGESYGALLQVWEEYHAYKVKSDLDVPHVVKRKQSFIV